MRRFILSAFLAALSALCGCGKKPVVPAAPPPLQVEEAARDELEAARAEALAYGKELRETLSAALEKGHAALAITVCSQEAESIARKHADKIGGRIGRTSLRFRNEKNEPDEKEIEVLRRFSASLAAGRDPAKLEFAEVGTGGNGGKVLRYFKGVPTESLCLTCHGTDVPPALLTQIKSIYPDDHATGFQEGELRGIISVSIPVK